MIKTNKRVKLFFHFVYRHAFFVLAILYFSLRLSYLTSLPIFNDEAIYLNWGWRSLHQQGFFFISLFDGKQPLFIWLLGLTQFLIADSLLGGRILSLMFGFVTIGGLYKLSKELFSQKGAIFTVLFYITSPLFFFYDRQALMESVVTVVGVWSVFLIYKILKTRERKYSIYLGVVLGIGMLTKINVLIFLISSFVVLFLFTRSKVLFLRQFIFTLCFALLIFLPILAQDLFWQTLSSNQRFALSISEISSLPFSLWYRSLTGFLEIIFWQGTGFLLVFAVGGYYLLLKKRRFLFLLVYTTISLFVMLLFVRNIIPRYLVSFLPLLSVLAGYSAYTLQKSYNWKGILLVSCVLLVGFMLSIIQIATPISYFSFLANVSKFAQKDEYVTMWPAGYGIDEVKKFIEEKAKDEKVYVAVRLDAGNPEDAIFSYFNNSKKIKPMYLASHIIPVDLAKIDCIQTRENVYFISRDTQLANLDKFLVEVKRVYKPENKSFIGIYTFPKNCQGTKYTLSLEHLVN